MNCFKKNHDNYLENYILPNILNYIFPNYDFVNSFTPSTYQKCIKVRKSYIEQLSKNNFKLKESDVFENYPINASNNKKLIGGYVSNLPYCRFLEKCDYDNNLLIKLDGNSKHEELNFLSSILRENFNFENVTLVFEIENYTNNDFLKLSYIFSYDNIVDIDDSKWLEYLQSAMTELTLLLSIEHAIWHLIVAHIIYIVKNKLYFTEILKVFEMASFNVFIKAFEVKTLLFGTPLVFGQILNNNNAFKKYLDNKITSFINNFDINSVFEDYFNLDSINPNLNWLYGMKDNILIIKNFVNNIITKKDISKEDKLINNYLLKKYKNNKDLVNIPDIKKLLEILFVVGSAFHSTTFEFTKIIMTDVFYNSKLDNLFYGISIQTIVADVSKVFGDEELYKGKLYKDEIKKLKEELENSRININNNFENNIYKNNIYGTKDNMMKKYSPHTYTSYV